MSGSPPEPLPRDLAALLPGDPRLAAQIAADLAARYSADGRFYHTLEHIHDVLRHVCPFLAQARAPLALQFAAWFHDAVYNPRRADNERQSAAYATAVLASLGAAADLVAETTRLIRLTEKHETAAADTDGRILLDADLAILAASPAHYDAYAQAIRREYAHVPEAAYRQGRLAVLVRFQARPSLYYLPEHADWEAAARLNLQREMAQLTREM